MGGADSGLTMEMIRLARDNIPKALYIDQSDLHSHSSSPSSNLPVIQYFALVPELFPTGS